MAGMPSTGGGGSGGGGGGGGVAGGGGAAGAGGVVIVPVVCGDNTRAATEACDDGAKAAGDGCSATCTVEAGYVCPVGQACKPECGDGVMIAPETCDDDNATAGDGCGATCLLEAGFECKTLAMPCTAICGDGILAGKELCDDKDILPGDGCTATCTREAGFVCDIPGADCRKKPVCTGGACTSPCGDGIVFGAEECDDGDLVAGDGCSATCTEENGFTCVTPATALPAQIAIPVTYRDFVSVAMGGSTKHPDFQTFNGANVTPGMVTNTLDVDGLPVYTGVCQLLSVNLGTALCPHGAQSTSEADFDQWFRDTNLVNVSKEGVMLLGREGDTAKYSFDGGAQFTPFTGNGWDAQGKEGLTESKNFGFTTELRYWFQYEGDEVLTFAGDDDVWVFINNKLAVDIGGLHPSQTRSVTLNVQTSAALGLNTIGNLYEIVLFHAERQPNGSNFKLTLSGFVNKTSTCTAN